MKKYNLQEWALIAEVVSGIAVITTLLILIFEIRGNTEILRISAYQEQISEISDWRDMIIANPELADLYSSFTRGEVPERFSKEGTQLSMAIGNLWNTYESAYFSYQSGLINDSEWVRMQRGVCGIYRNLVSFPGYLGAAFFYSSEQFNQYVTDLCMDGDANGGI